jgi:hypothetical protein
LTSDRKIIGWSLSSGMSVEETSLAWRMAIKTEASQRDYFILTEVFNTPVKFTNVVDSYKIITSMSRKGTVGTMQWLSFFKTLKTEQIYGNNISKNK